MGHIKYQQQAFKKPHWQFRYSHGGTLRQKRKGRSARPLSTKTAIHLVFKVDRRRLKKGLRSPLGFKICQTVLQTYSKRFFVKVEQQAVCQDHIHLLVRLSRRSQGQHFFRVVAGQIAQILKHNGFWVTGTQGIWKFRPFTRVIVGWKAYQIARDYVRLNEKEASGQILYQRQRLRGLSAGEWELLWT